MNRRRLLRNRHWSTERDKWLAHSPAGQLTEYRLMRFSYFRTCGLVNHKRFWLSKQLLISFARKPRPSSEQSQSDQSHEQCEQIIPIAGIRSLIDHQFADDYYHFTSTSRLQSLWMTWSANSIPDSLSFASETPSKRDILRSIWSRIHYKSYVI